MQHSSTIHPDCRIGVGPPSERGGSNIGLSRIRGWRPGQADPGGACFRGGPAIRPSRLRAYARLTKCPPFDSVPYNESWKARTNTYRPTNRLLPVQEPFPEEVAIRNKPDRHWLSTGYSRKARPAAAASLFASKPPGLPECAKKGHNDPRLGRQERSFRPLRSARRCIGLPRSLYLGDVLRSSLEHGT